MDPKDFLNELEQRTGLCKLYTQITSCYPVSGTSSDSAIIGTLTNGLERLSAAFPWLAGQVVNDGAKTGDSDLFKIVPFEKAPRLVVKDLRDDRTIPTMDAMKQANFPFTMLDESIVAPRRTLPGSPDEADTNTAPVFLVQATFITGGLLLTFVGQHNTMDMTGQGHVIDLFSKACRNEPFTSEELVSGNLPRRNIIPFLDESYKPGPELDFQIVKSKPAAPVTTSPEGQSTAPALPSSTWAYFTFSPSSLADLKSIATTSLVPPSTYVSTDDALSAFIWQSVTRARLARLSPSTPSTFARAVNVRRYLKVSPTYLGLLQNMTYHKKTLQELVEAPLGHIASNLRLAVDPKTSTLEYDTLSLVTFSARASDKNSTSVTATIDPSSDIMLSSWAAVDCYHLDFGLGLGKPVAVRRPRFVPVESLMYLMPRALDGEIAAGICLRDEDLERLRNDEEFTKYGSYIG